MRTSSGPVRWSKQNQVLDEARRRFMESVGFCSSPCGGPTIIHFEAILKEIGDLATKQAVEYLRVAHLAPEGYLSGDSQEAPCGQSQPTLLEQLVETYRMLIIPDKTLLAYFEFLGADVLRREFRRLAMLIHPDKNKHPSAKTAFQKLYNNFLAAVQKNN